MTRIAYIVSQYPAPSHTFIRREIEALRKRGLSIVPISIRPGTLNDVESVPTVLGPSWVRLLAVAVRVALIAPLQTGRTWLAAQRHRSLGIRGWIWAQFHFVETLVLTNLLQNAGAERVHSHFANSGATVAMLAAQHLRLPWSLTLHGISETDPPAGALLARKIEQAEFVSCASWFMKAQGMRIVATEHWHKFHVIRCGVELNRIERTMVYNTISRLRFITVGRIAAEKGYPGLMDAFERLTAAGVDAELVIVGDGPLRDFLQKRVGLSAFPELISLRGALPEHETLEEIAKADIFVLPSLMEGLPVVLMEAMALEKPVIAAYVAGIPEIVRNCETGLLFRPADWDNLYQCMLSLATDHELRQKLAGASRSSIMQDYDIDRAVRPLAQLFSIPAVTNNFVERIES